jgi:hypothetical protein
MKRHHVVCGFVFLFVLLATTQTQARTQINISDQGKVNKRVVFVNHDQFLQMVNNLGLTVRELKVPRDVLKKLRNVSVKGCGCGAPPDDEEFTGGCVSGCLHDWGVSYGALVACAGVCGVTLVGCAACVGIGEWIVAYCGMKCAWQTGYIMDLHKIPLTPKLRRSETHALKLARLSPKPTNPAVASLK